MSIEQTTKAKDQPSTAADNGKVGREPNSAAEQPTPGPQPAAQVTVEVDESDVVDITIGWKDKPIFQHLLCVARRTKPLCSRGDAQETYRRPWDALKLDAGFGWKSVIDKDLERDGIRLAGDLETKSTYSVMLKYSIDFEKLFYEP